MAALVASRHKNKVRIFEQVIEPVHLQVVCFQLWEKPRTNPAEIGMKELAAIGDVDSALGQYYAEPASEIAETSRVKEGPAGMV